MSYLDPIDHTVQEFGDLYDELPLWSAPFGLQLLDLVPMRAGLTILDVGAGTGFLTIELAERCGPTAQIIAVDPWHAAMNRLRRKVDQRRLENVRLIEQEATTLDLPDGSIDVVISNLGIHNFDDPAAILRTCFRLAKPGASLILTTNLSGHMAEFYEVFRAVLIELGQHERLATLDAHINHRGTVESVTALLQSVGFAVGDVVSTRFRMRFADGSSLLHHSFIRLGFTPGWKSVPAPGRLFETFEALRTRLDTLASQQGELALTIPMAGFVARKPSA